MASPQDVDQTDLVSKFREVTGADEERARFYLESANWQLQIAMGSFFEGGEVGGMEDSDSEDLAGALLTGQTGGSAPAPPQTTVPQIPVRGERTGPMTLDELRNNAPETDSSDDDDNKQAFYAGGSQSSGQQVLGPPKARDEIIADMFKKAREHGAEEVQAQLARQKGNRFGGVGYKLGESESEPSVAVGATPAGSSGAAGGGGVRDVVLRLWSTGFTIDDGPLRSYKDPNNLAFLDSVKRSEVPAELRKEFAGQEISMRMEDRRGEDYVQPKVASRPFQGRGQMLGSPAPATVGSTAPSSESDRKANEEAARGEIQIASGEPTTSIQLRLVDGSRLVAQFNHTHTVNDLYGFVNRARPEYSAMNYVLTMFPNIEVTDKEKSLKDANILSSALIQKMKS